MEWEEDEDKGKNVIFMSGCLIKGKIAHSHALLLSQPCGWPINRATSVIWWRGSH